MSDPTTPDTPRRLAVPNHLLPPDAARHGQQCNDGLPMSPEGTYECAGCAPSPLWRAVEEAIYVTLVRIAAPESADVSLRDTAGLLTGTIASIVRADPVATDKQVDALKAQVARREATISAYETALTESHARIVHLERERVRRTPDGPALQYLPLSEVTDGHVDAYLKAYRQHNNQGSLYRDAVRAGLAAIQWPSITSPTRCSPEMREVPWTLLREGDTVTATWVKDEPMGADTAAFRIAGDGAGWLKNPVVTRPASTLPDKPNSVGEATINGVKGVRIALRRTRGQQLVWVVLDAYPGNLPPTVPAEAITDYVPLLDGEEGRS